MAVILASGVTEAASSDVVVTIPVSIFLPNATLQGMTA